MTALVIGLGVAFVLASVAAAVVTGMKAKWVVLGLGFVSFLSLAWFFGAGRAAKPDSWWARRFYGPEKRERAQARHASPVYRSVAISAVVLSIVPSVALLAGWKAYRVPSAAMEPTIRCPEPAPGCSGETSDRILGPRFVLGIEPDRGDIVAFELTEEVSAQCAVVGPITYVKRVIGLPGETISADGGVLRVDGRTIEEPYIDERARDETRIPEQQVPAGHYFVVGDNRSMSCDSRVYGPIPESALVAQIVARYWPPDRIGSL